MKCWERFDYIAMMGYAPKKERAAKTMLECSRVGLFPETHWNVRTAYEGVAQRHIPHNRAMGRAAYFSITMGHLRMVKTAYELGAERGLFLEDDIRFLKDEREVHAIMDALPEDAEVALLDWVHRNKATLEEKAKQNAVEKANGHWGRFENLRSCAAYMLTRRAMAMYVQLLENAEAGANTLKICDQFWPDMAASGLKCYCAFPQPCVQGAGGGATNHEEMWKRYNEIGVKREDYSD